MKFKAIVQAFFIFASCICIYSCEELEETIEVVECEKFIDFDVIKPFSEYTEKEKEMYFEARDRFDKFVYLSDNIFIFSDECSPELLNISDDIFNYFQSLLNQTNEELSALVEIEHINGDLILPSNGVRNVLRLKTRAVEDGIGNGGGVTKIIITWYGYDIYLSNSALHQIALGFSITTVLSALIPDVTFSKVATVISSLCALAAGELEHYYPNGVILSVVSNHITPGCIPFNIQGQ